MRKTGRKPIYNDDFAKQAGNLAEFGASDREIAIKLKIAESTFYEWKKTYPALTKALDEGRRRHIDNDIEPSYMRQAVPHDEVVQIRELQIIGVTRPPVSKMSKGQLIKFANGKLKLKVTRKETIPEIIIAIDEAIKSTSITKMVTVGERVSKNVVNVPAAEKLLKVNKPEKYGDKLQISGGLKVIFNETKNYAGNSPRKSD